MSVAPKKVAELPSFRFECSGCEAIRDQKMRNEEKLVKLINGIEPDLIIFTGDTLNTPAALQLFKGTLKQLKAKLAKFAVRGNFDVWYWPDLDQKVHFSAFGGPVDPGDPFAVGTDVNVVG